ncbi:lig_chan-Glu_bd domain-containing protein [Nephila pilipes]|uniref:Lig_chan-Glu_bd domain-containing protein n=1 Tax=Nephila pilipes TaxID=299642 RepID=A0A8X6NP97_NEPPI|nr:lig_chan-Glu_bd domain-containing protein [Nephila pilipes]GFU39201.1 lig_chan-Glu_bd domain-containing protein [Nephila pilipes]
METLYFPSKIKIAAVLLKSILTVSKVNDRIVLNGLEGEMLKCLMEKLKFEFELVLPNYGQYGSRDSNGTWDGVIGMVRRGEADIGLATLSITEDRWEAVDFSISYLVNDRVFAIKEPGEMPKVTAFTYPFSRNVWILYTLVILAATVLFQRIMFRRGTLLGSFLSVLGSVVSQSMENVRETPWRRVLFGLWMTIAAVMPFLYNTSFLSYLTMPEKVPVPRNFEELSKAVLSGKYKCLPTKGTIEQELLLKSRIDYLVKIGEMIGKNGWEYSYVENFPELLDDPVAIITSNGVIKLLLGSPPYITVKASDDYFGIWNVGIAIKKDFCCRKRLNDVLYRIVSGGFFEKWIDDISFANTLHKRLKKKHEEPKLQLTLEDLKLAFFTLFSGYALALLAFLAELLSPKYFEIFHS